MAKANKSGTKATKTRGKGKAGQDETGPSLAHRNSLDAAHIVADESDLTAVQVAAHRSTFGSQDISGGAPGNDPRIAASPEKSRADLRKAAARGDLSKAEAKQAAADDKAAEKQAAESKKATEKAEKEAAKPGNGE